MSCEQNNSSHRIFIAWSSFHLAPLFTTCRHHHWLHGGVGGGGAATEGTPADGTATADDEVGHRPCAGRWHAVLLSQELPGARPLHLLLVAMHQHVRRGTLLVPSPRQHARGVTADIRPGDDAAYLPSSKPNEIKEAASFARARNLIPPKLKLDLGCPPTRAVDEDDIPGDIVEWLQARP